MWDNRIKISDIEREEKFNGVQREGDRFKETVCVSLMVSGWCHGYVR